tara:strand:+ start:662 stop:883 length:222 start_codon:yes stop_codon:yes gene_type:complete
MDNTDSVSYTGDTVKWNFPEGEEAVKFVAQLSTNMRPSVHQKYITLGAVCAAFPEVHTERIISILKDLGHWED